MIAKMQDYARGHTNSLVGMIWYFDGEIVSHSMLLKKWNRRVSHFYSQE